MADVNWSLGAFDPFKGLKEGSDYGKQIFDQAALLKAGSQYAAGDPASAANTVASRGDFEKAGKLQDYATNREAGNLYAGGDYSGAGKALARGGNLTGAETLADKQIKTVEAQQNALGKVGGFLEASGGAPDAWDWAARSLQAVGVQPDTITKLQQQYATNPKQTVAQMKALANHKYTYEKTDDGVLRQFDESGNLTHTFGSEGGPYKGTGIEAQDSNIFVRAYKDPSVANSPEYALAYDRMTQQKPQFDLPSGKILWTGGTVPAWAPKPGSYQGGAPPPAASSPNGPPPSGTPAPGPGASVVPRASNVAETPSGVTERPPYTGTDADTHSGRAVLAAGVNAPTVPGASAPAAAIPAAPPQTGPTPALSPGAPNVRVQDVPGIQPRGTVRDLTPKELYDRGFGPGARGQINTQTGEISIKQQSTPDERKTAGYSKRVDEAAQNLARLEQQGIIKPTAQILLSEQNGVFRLVLSNPKDRQFVQASKEWLAPILRKDTGAAVTDKEFDEYSYIYIPRAEDTPEVLAQKAAARRVAEDVLYAEAGSSYADMFGARPARVKPNAQRGPYAPGKGQPFIPKPSIDALRQHPQRAAEFDKKYGAGAAASVLGR